MARDKLKKQKDNNEFFTSLNDIENEIQYYWQHLEGKKIWCNCDDPNWSNFNHYFKEQSRFHEFEVKFTNYKIVYKNDRLYKKIKLEKPIYFKNEKGKIEKTNYIYKNKNGYCKGDFRASEQDVLWKWADIIITNPPFTWFRLFFKRIIQEKVKFLIVSPQADIGCKEIFPYFQQNKVWLGVNHHLTHLTRLDQWTGKTIELKNPHANVRTCTWFTNLDHEQRHRPISLVNWNKEKFVKYENYNAYETFWLYGKKRIAGRAQYPFTDKILGVPITFFQKYCPEQFEIIGNQFNIKISNKPNLIRIRGTLKGKDDTGKALVIKTSKQDKYALYIDKNKNYYNCLFSRVFIRIKKEYYNKVKEQYED